MSDSNLDRPAPISEQDIAFAREIKQGQVTRQRLYEALDGSLKSLFSHCEWRVTCYEIGLTELEICCPNLAVYKRLYNRAITIQSRLEVALDSFHTKLIISCRQDSSARYENEIDYEPCIESIDDETMWDLHYLLSEEEDEEDI